MELAHLREFAYLADTLSFKRTADHFYVSRSVISRHLAALEDAIGAKLVDRSKGTVRLTDVGEVFYRDAIIMLRDYEAALDHVRIAQSTQTRIVRVGYLRNAARPIIVQFARYMRKHHPDVQLIFTGMEFNELRHALDDGAVDIALAVNVSPSESHDFRSTLIYTDRFYAIMRKDHPLAGNVNGVTVAELPPDKLLLPDSFVHSGEVEVPDNLDLAKSQARTATPFFDVDTLYLKVQAEDFIVFSSSMNSGMFGDDLASIPILDIDSTFSVSAFYRHGIDEDTFEMCRTALEACREKLRAEGVGLPN